MEVETSCDSSKYTISPNFDVGPTPSIFSHSDLIHLIKCNDPPSPTEEVALNGIISEAESHLLMLRQKIESITGANDNPGARLSFSNTAGTVATLVEKYQETEYSIRAAKRLFNPVRRLPVEILHEIFLLVVEFPPPKVWDRRSHCWRIQHKKPSLWDLELVSKSWRFALLSCSHAWSYICLRDTDSFEITADNSAFRGLMRQVERSKPRPLSVSIHQSSRRGYPDLLIAALIHFAGRIVTLQLASGIVLLQDLNPLQFFLLSLQHLSIISVIPDLDAVASGVFKAFSFAPLRSLELWQVSSPDAFVISWPQIRRYKHLYCYSQGFWGPSDSLSLDALWQISRFSDIEECEMSCTELFPHQLQVPGLLDMITLPELHTLRMLTSESKGFETVPLLLDHLTTPALARVTMQAFEQLENPAPNAVPSLFRLFHRSHCSITCLDLTDVRVSEADMETLSHLELVYQALQELHLSNVGSDSLSDRFLSSLRYIRPTLSPFPSLHTLRLCGKCNFVPQRFVEVVASRCMQDANQEPVRIQNVKLVWVLGPDQLDHCQYIREKLVPCQRGGLNLEVRSVQGL
ncbi:uncharacterized protein BT62DRAFT_1079048 [Guyanagaster necrorhizus]|uniref:F-box domain-containing protein n=1 Tax=Guyanagaster necrorhizus TaxID=856835 RepID=A0A9P8AP72_9AGAR|nr:uncharacterized protein BT62DRAFT_1079048 [Guyanagaster necrorhizus MCA 3950]KAG7442669.1 hypothetical protein BT62DRAFT_1079048 [Guyanagaster necrorhizus MCA 3950]